MAIFELLRLSLSIPRFGPLISEVHGGEPKISREDFLCGLFSERREFFHSGKLFTFAPSPTNSAKDKKLSGYVGKQVEQEFQAGPDKLFAITKEKHWRAAFVTIDISEDSQLIYFEKRGDVGKAQAIIMSFVEQYICDFKGFAWHIDAEYLTVEESFWAAVSEHRGEITEAIFEFVPPNVVRGSGLVALLCRPGNPP